MITKPDLNLEVSNDGIIVTMPGTSYKAIYRRSDRGVNRVEVTSSDLSAPITLREFIARADEFVNDKARELGWIV